MPALDPKKKRRALKLRLQRKSFAEIARTLHMAPATLRKLEYGWIDKQDVRHRGWRHEVEKRWDEDEKAEIECGLALKEERVKVLKRLTLQAIDKVESEFPAVTMASPSDWKTLVSEIRELLRLLSDEAGSRRGAGRTVATRTLITLEEIQEAYEGARAVEVEEAGPAELSPPEGAGPFEPAAGGTDLERPDTKDAEAERAGSKA